VIDSIYTKVEFEIIQGHCKSGLLATFSYLQWTN